MAIGTSVRNKLLDHAPSQRHELEAVPPLRVLGALCEKLNVPNDRRKRRKPIDDYQPSHGLRTSDPLDGEADHGVPVVCYDNKALCGRPAEDVAIFGLCEADVPRKDELDCRALAKDASQDVLVEAVIGKESDHPVRPCRSLFS